MVLGAALTAGDGAAGDRFGESVDVSGMRAVVGAPGVSESRGAVYVFDRSGSTWTQGAKLDLGSLAAPNDEFGHAVAIESSRIVVGAYLRDRDRDGETFEDEGEAYAYRLKDGAWQLETTVDPLYAPDGHAGDNVGYSVAISGNKAILGAPQLLGRYVYDHTAIDTHAAGYAYVRDVSPPRTVTYPEEQSLLIEGAKAQIVKGTVGGVETSDFHFMDITDVTIRTGAGNDTLTLGEDGIEAYGLMDLLLDSGEGDDLLTLLPFDLLFPMMNTFIPGDLSGWNEGDELTPEESEQLYQRVTCHFIFDGGPETDLVSLVSQADWKLVKDRLIPSGGGELLLRNVEMTNPENVPPQIAPIGDLTLWTGETLTLTGSFADPVDYSFTGTVDYGDGPVPLALNADRTFQLSESFAVAGDYTVTVTITDDGGASDVETFQVTVLQAPMEPIDALVDVYRWRLTYDRATGLYSLCVTVTNASDADIDGPIYIALQNISEPSVTVANADGVTHLDDPYVDLSDLPELADGRLSVDESVTAIIYFSSPLDLRFDFDVSVYAATIGGGRVILPGDANGDDKVDGGDLALWQQNYDPVGANPSNDWGRGDWNEDGKIDGVDLAIWQQHYDPTGKNPGDGLVVDDGDLALWQQDYDPIGSSTEGVARLVPLGQEAFDLADGALQDEELSEDVVDAVVPASDADLFSSGVRFRAWQRSRLMRPLSSMTGVSVPNAGPPPGANVGGARHSRLGRLSPREDADLVDILQLSALGVELHF